MQTLEFQEQEFIQGGELGKSNFIWDITSSTDIDIVRTRSTIPTTVERTQTSLRQTEFLVSNPSIRHFVLAI